MKSVTIFADFRETEIQCSIDCFNCLISVEKIMIIKIRKNCHWAQHTLRPIFVSIRSIKWMNIPHPINKLLLQRN